MNDMYPEIGITEVVGSFIHVAYNKTSVIHCFTITRIAAIKTLCTLNLADSSAGRSCIM